ncbi:MAG: lipopolysaccharide kinase InaA family protein [Myxococcota bacterium]
MTGGDTEMGKRLEAHLRGVAAGEILSLSARRQVVALPPEAGEGECVAKIFEAPRGPIAWLRRHLGLGPADREWRALKALRQAGLPVAAPQQRHRLADGRDCIVMERLGGHSAIDALASDFHVRRTLLEALGESVARLHGAGFVHGDLHLGNARVLSGGEVVWLDFQRTRRRRGSASRFRDLGCLDHSLRRFGASRSERLRTRLAALGPGDASKRHAAVARIARESERRAGRHARSRLRHASRPGRRMTAVQIGAFKGLRLRSFARRDLEEALLILAETPAAPGCETLKDDARARVIAARVGDQKIVIKEVRKGGFARRLADSLRGSPGRRAFCNGHLLLDLGLGAATPLAYCEVRRFGLPQRSLVILEDLRPRVPLGKGTRIPTEALVDWLCRLHGAGVVHGDLQASHLYVDPENPAEPRLIDLEGLRLCRRISRGQRIQALAELNASLEDAALPSQERTRAFEAYARRLPFAAVSPRSARESALADVVRRSRARGHHWRGADCTAASRAGDATPASD